MIVDKPKKFRDLSVGTEFDFIKPDSIYNSFFLRCVKTDNRTYRDENGQTHRVGSINCEVYNVGVHYGFDQV